MTENAETYRHRAEECLNKAGEEADPEQRLHLLFLAERWLTLAQKTLCCDGHEKVPEKKIYK